MRGQQAHLLVIGSRQTHTSGSRIGLVQVNLILHSAFGFAQESRQAEESCSWNRSHSAVKTPGRVMAVSEGIELLVWSIALCDLTVWPANPAQQNAQIKTHSDRAEKCMDSSVKFEIGDGSQYDSMTDSLPIPQFVINIPQM